MLRSLLSARSPLRKTLTVLTLWSAASIGFSAALAVSPVSHRASVALASESVAQSLAPRTAGCVLEQLQSSFEAARTPTAFSEEQKRALLAPFIKDGRPILVFTDAHFGQKSGVITVMKNLKREVERLTDGKVKLEYVMPDQFKWKIKTKYQDLIFPLATQKSIGEIIAKANPQAIHVMTEGTLGRSVRKYLVKNKIPFNTAYHTMFPEFVRDTILKLGMPRFSAEFARYLTNRSLRKFHSASAGILVYTKSMAELLVRSGYDPAKIRLADLGVDSARFNPGAKDPELYKGLKGPITVFAGRVAPEKNIEDFLKMDIPGTKVVIGGGPMLDELKAKYPGAVFVGARKPEEMPKYLASADYMVFPSLTDTLGLVQPEANAAGIPVVAYRVQGPVDMIVLPDQGVLADYDKHAPQQNIRNLEKAWHQLHALNREGARNAVLPMSWERSALQFLSEIPRLPKPSVSTH